MNIDHITDQIAEHARVTPNKTAVKHRDRTLSYAGLMGRVNRIAAQLHGRFEGNTNYNPCITLLLDRSIELIQSILGVLHCGLVFVPINPAFPENRIRLLIQETGTQAVITSKEYYPVLKRVMEDTQIPDVVIVDNDETDLPGPKNMESVYDDPCYIYFTSGSTGTPRGILGSHRGLLHFIRWEIEEFGITADFNISQMTNPSFDPFLRDILVPLVAGGTCCIPDQNTILDPSLLVRWIDEEKITLIHMVPSLFKALSLEVSDAGDLASLKYILLAGELLRGNDIRRFAAVFGNRVQLVNLYGPTETTLAKMFYRIQAGDENKTVIPVGKPIKGAQVTVYDHLTQRMCRVGKQGEVFIRTPFRSYGYINDISLNSDAFFVNPATQNTQDLIYKTGDLGRLLPDGNIELNGRIGFQVKIRGFRVEPGEIESVLLKIEDIREAVVVPREDTSKGNTLCAFFVPSSPDTFRLNAAKVSEWQNFVKKYLPDYMIPSFFIPVPEIPLNINGKTDREALGRYPIPVLTDSGFKPPADEKEEKLAAIWSEIMGIDIKGIGSDSNFFSLGGHSLTAIDLVSKIHKVFDIKVPLTEIFKLQTLCSIAQLLRTGNAAAPFLSIEKTEKKEYYELSSAQKRHFFMQQLDLKSTAYNMFKVFTLKGPVDRHRLDQAFYRLIERHESLRTSFHIVNRKPVQIIHDRVDFVLQYNDGPGKDVNPMDLIRPFDLSRAPLMRVTLIHVEDEIHILVVDLHHIITNAYSSIQLIGDFGAIYNGEEPPPLPLQYKDFSEWQNRFLESEDLRVQESFWITRMSGKLPLLNLPSDFSRGSIKSTAGATLYFSVSPELNEKLHALASGKGVTMFMLLIAAYFVVLHKYSSQEDIIIGTPITGRSHNDLKHLVGMLVNMLPIRGNPRGTKPFSTFLNEIKETSIGCFQNQDYPFDRMVNQLGVQRDAGRNPLFDVVFELLAVNKKQGEVQAEKEKNTALQVLPYRLSERLSPFDLILFAFVAEDAINLNLTYVTRLFKESTVRKLTEHYIEVLEQIARNGDVPLSEIALTDRSLVSASEVFSDEQSSFDF